MSDLSDQEGDRLSKSPLESICISPPSSSASPPREFQTKEGRSVRYCRVRAFVEQHSVFIQALMDFHWGSWARPTSWQAARQRRELWTDRWHFTSAGGSTESRVSPKSSWGGTSFRPQGPPPPLFRRNKRGRKGEGFSEHLSRRVLATAFSYGKQKVVFLFGQLAPTAPLFLCPSLSQPLFSPLWIMSLFVIQLACWDRLHK